MSPVDRPVLQVVVGSTRPGRAGLPVANWVFELAEKHGAFETRFADLAEVALPLLDEPHHPRLRRYTHDHTRRWSATIDGADALVLVVPEYNHGVNSATKNAIDYLVHEWAHKPVGLVSYGGVSGGVRAVHALRPTLSTLRMFPLADGVIIPFVGSFLHGEGDDRRFVPNETIEDSAAVMLDELARTAPVLRQLRAG